MMGATFRISGMLAVMAIGILSVVPGKARPHVFWSGAPEHVVAYFVAATLLCLGFIDSRASHPARPESNAALSIGFLLTGYGGILEVVQLFIPGRVPGMLDWSASTLGAWLGVGLVWLLHGRVRRAFR